jgi:hypothetical protein
MGVWHKSDWGLSYAIQFLHRSDGSNLTEPLTMLRSSQGFKFGLHSNLNLIPPNPDLCSTLLLIILLPHEIVGPKNMSKMVHKPPSPNQIWYQMKDQY